MDNVEVEVKDGKAFFKINALLDEDQSQQLGNIILECLNEKIVKFQFDLKKLDDISVSLVNNFFIMKKMNVDFVVICNPEMEKLFKTLKIIS